MASAKPMTTQQNGDARDTNGLGGSTIHRTCLDLSVVYYIRIRTPAHYLAAHGWGARRLHFADAVVSDQPAVLRQDGLSSAANFAIEIHVKGLRAASVFSSGRVSEKSGRRSMAGSGRPDICGPEGRRIALSWNLVWRIA